MKLKRNCLTILLVTILTMSFCYFHVKTVYAVTYEFETSFEESDPFGDWTPCPVFGYGYEIQTDIVYAGVNACRSDLTDGAMTYELASNYSAHYCLVHFYINGTVPEGYGGGIFIRIWDPEITVYIETNASRGAGKSPYIRFYDQMNDDFNVLDPQGLALETWHTVQIYTEGDSASANHKCWVNGRLIASESDDTTGYNVTGVEICNYRWSGEWDGRVFVDDFRSNDKIPHYYFNFNFYDLDSEDVELYVDWALWNSTHDIEYTEGTSTLEFGTYYLNTSKYGHLINTTTLDTDTYGNTTINIYLNMKRHQSCPNGFIISNDSISSVTIHAETPQLLKFTIDGTTPAQLGIGVAKNASEIIKTGGNWLSGWDYRKQKCVNGSSGGAVTEYALGIIVVHYGSGTDDYDANNGYEQNVYLDGKCQADFRDLKFTDADNNLLNYHQFEKIDEDYAKYWVTINLTQNEETHFNLYYGNEDAEDGGEALADFFVMVGYMSDSLGSYCIGSNTACFDPITDFQGPAYESKTVMQHFKTKTLSPPTMKHYSGTRDGAYFHRKYGTPTIGPLSDYTTWDPEEQIRVNAGDYVGNIQCISGAYHFKVETGYAVKRSFTDPAICSNVAYSTYPQPTRMNLQCALRKYIDPEPQQGEWGNEESNQAEWTYVSSPSHIYFTEVRFCTYAITFPSITDPVVGPHTPMNNRVKVTVRLNGEWVKDCNVTVEGGPDDRIEWALTDVFGSVKFRLKTGSYDIVASYEQYRKVKPVYVSTHMTIGIDLTEEDIIRPDVLPEDLEDFLTWVKLPEIDFTTETFLVFILPLIVLVVYAVKKASEGPKKKWKYGYLD